MPHAVSPEIFHFIHTSPVVSLVLPLSPANDFISAANDLQETLLPMGDCDNEMYVEVGNPVVPVCHVWCSLFFVINC